MSERTFKNKWATLARSSDTEKQKEESDLFVPPGQSPKTQRQLNLYYYFLFIKNVLNQTKAQKVLEVGCGRGTISLYLAKHFGLTVHLLDDAPDAITVAKDLFNLHGAQASFHVGDALKTLLPDASFDAVVSIGLAEHFNDVRDLFAEQYRLLKPGGVMISLNIPKKFSIQYLNTIMRFVKKTAGAYRDSITKDYYRNSFSPQAYEAAAKKVGFERIAITPVTPFPLYTPVSFSADKQITNINKKILKIRSMFMSYPYKTNIFIAQAHFLVAYKPAS